MRRPSWVSSEVDLTRPSAARVYDFYLGGSHNLEVDRRMAREAISLWPDLPKIMQSNRAFLRRSVRYLAEQGITQFLDIGSGIPTVGNVHEAAQQAHPQARVVMSTTTRWRWPTAAPSSPARSALRSSTPTCASRRPSWSSRRSARRWTWTSRSRC